MTGEMEQFGDFDVGGLIHSGSMGMVHRAVDRNGRVVALKRLSRSMSTDPDLRRRFRREQEIANALHHDNVVQIIEWGEIDGQLFLTMELIDGDDLARKVKTSAPLRIDETLRILTQVADGLDAAHRHGIIHRDVKPANVMIRAASPHVAVVVDFGIALDMDGTQVTATSAFVGTLPYMAPERFATGTRPTPAVDVYSLTVMLFECLAGYRPFSGDFMQLVGQHLDARRPTLAERAALPPAIDPVIARGMAIEPENRYPTCADLIAAAGEALRTPVRTSTLPIAQPKDNTASRWRWRAAMGAAGIALIVGIGISYFLPVDPVLDDSTQVLALAATVSGPDPFTSSFAVADASDISPADLGSTLVGDGNRIYGAARGGLTCDRNLLLSALAVDARRGAAWGSVLQVDGEELRAAVFETTPVVLRVDVLVERHGYTSGGTVTTRRSILQAGTAVLVDRRGTPVVRCTDGAPLTKPESRHDSSMVTGAIWPGIDPAGVSVIDAAPADVVAFVLRDLSADCLVRRAGTAGDADLDCD